MGRVAKISNVWSGHDDYCKGDLSVAASTTASSPFLFPGCRGQAPGFDGRGARLREGGAVSYVTERGGR